MRKLTLFFAAIFISIGPFISAPVLAASNDGPAKAGQVKVLSPADFKKNVNKVDQQTKAQLRNELNQQLSNKPAIPLQQPTPPPQSSSVPVVGPATNAAPQATVPQSMPAQAPPPVAARPSAPPTAAPPAPADTSIINTPSGSQSQVYTGFQGQQQNAPSQNPPPAQSGGGWNIKY